MFGKNLFQDVHLLTTYKELLGVENSKPFECVGTPDEVKAAFYLAYKNGEYKNDSIMTFFEDNILPTLSDPEELVVEALASGDSTRIPDEFKNLLK
jgi:predicted ATP-dependent endonuclease of OLD family